MPNLIQQPNLTRKLAAGDGYEQLYWPLPTSQTRSRLLGEWPSMQMSREESMSTSAYLIPPVTDPRPTERWLESLPEQERQALMLALNLPDPEPESEAA
jgi:hypothetical protein